MKMYRMSENELRQDFRKLSSDRQTGPKLYIMPLRGWSINRNNTKLHSEILSSRRHSKREGILGSQDPQ